MLDARAVVVVEDDGDGTAVVVSTGALVVVTIGASVVVVVGTAVDEATVAVVLVEK